MYKKQDVEVKSTSCAFYFVFTSLRRVQRHRASRISFRRGLSAGIRALLCRCRFRRLWARHALKASPLYPDCNPPCRA